MKSNARETDAIEAVTERLKHTYRETRTPDEVEAVVAAAHASFDDRRIRDFVPVLVERKARAALGKASG